MTEPHNLPPAPGLAGNTLRQIIFVSIGGTRLRFRFSNEYGTSPLTIQAARVAKAGEASRILPHSDVPLRFDGQPSVNIPAGQTRVSDPFDFALEPLTRLTVSTHFGSVSEAVTGHPGSRTTSFLIEGDATAGPFLKGAVTTDHWYVLSGLDVMGSADSRAIVILGDSLTDGRGSTTDQNDRWPDALSRRLRANPATQQVAVLNAGVGGNAVVSGGIGPTALARFERDVLGQCGVRWLIVLAGVNDVGNVGAHSAPALIAAYESFISKARERNILTYGVPLLPFAGSQYWNPVNEAARNAVNDWIRAPGHFDAVLDLERAVRAASDASRLEAEYDSGDHLHLSPAGYLRMANSIDLALFSL